MRPCGQFKERLSSLSMVGWDNRPYLAAGFEASKESLLGYSFWFRDRCRSGLSGTPGKRVLVKANRGFEALPVRAIARTGNSIFRRRDSDGPRERGGALRVRGSAQSHHPGGVAAKILGQRGINPDLILIWPRRRAALQNFPDYPFQTKSTLLSIRGSRLWWTGQPRAADSRSFLCG